MFHNPNYTYYQKNTCRVYCHVKWCAKILSTMCSSYTASSLGTSGAFTPWPFHAHVTYCHLSGWRQSTAARCSIHKWTHSWVWRRSPVYALTCAYQAPKCSTCASVCPCPSRSSPVCMIRESFHSWTNSSHVRATSRIAPVCLGLVSCSMGSQKSDSHSTFCWHKCTFETPTCQSWDT